MDEFDKIRELSEDIVGRKEPNFRQEGSQNIEQDNEIPLSSDDASLYQFPLRASDNLHTMPFDEIEEKNIVSLKIHIVALGIFIGVLTVVIIGFVFFGSSEETIDEVITIAATPEPVKIRPEQPGGMVIPDQDKLVYNRIRSKDSLTKVEKLFPEVAKPTLPEIVLIENDNSPVVDEKVSSNKENVDIESEKTNDLLKKKNTTIETEKKDKSIIVEKVPPTPKKEVIKLPKKSTSKQTTSKITQKNKSKKITPPSKSWRVQVLSSSNKKSVERAWPQILRKNKALLSNMSYDIVSAKIPGKGVFYRLQLGHFTSREKAMSLCLKLKARRQECVPVKQ